MIGLTLDHAAQDQGLALASLAAAKFSMFDRQGNSPYANPNGPAHKGKAFINPPKLW
jgi:hypothetical protein